MNKLVKKFAIVGVTVATTVSLAGMGAVPVAGAQTIAELQAQISALQAQITALLGGGSSTTTCYNWSGNLTIGSTGPDVTTLQNYLTGTGHFTFSGGATGYFGPITQAAVAAWQAANGVAPAVGYWGPISQAKYTQLCGSTGTPGDDTDDGVVLEGGAGSISDADFITAYNNEEVGEGADDVVVAGLDVEAEGSDIMLTAVTLDFDYADTGADTRLKDYVTEVSVWFDGDEVARVDADEFDSDNSYMKTVALDSGAVIREDERGDLTVALSGVSPMDSANAGENWNVAFEGVRFKDGQGAHINETTQGDITIGNDDTTTDAGERQFSFETFATAADLELKFKLDDDSVNDAHIINVHASNTTENVSILSFTIEVEGASDVLLKDLPVNLDSVESAGNDPDDLVSALTLWMDGAQVGSENLSTADADDSDETVTFDNINVTLEAGETYAFLVKADFRAVSSTLAEGDTLQAQIGATERNAIDAEDEEGEPVADADATGTAVGDAHAVYDAGIEVTLVSTSATKTLDGAGASTPVDDQATYTIVVDIKAFDSDIYIPHNADDTALDAGDAFSFGYTVTDGTLTTTAAQTLDSNGDDGTNAWYIQEGTTDRFTLTVNLTATTGTADFASIALNGIGWGTTDITTSTNDYSFNLDAFKTGSVFMTAQ